VNSWCRTVIPGPVGLVLLPAQEGTVERGMTVGATSRGGNGADGWRNIASWRPRGIRTAPAAGRGTEGAEPESVRRDPRRPGGSMRGRRVAAIRTGLLHGRGAGAASSPRECRLALADRRCAAVNGLGGGHQTRPAVQWTPKRHCCDHEGKRVRTGIHHRFLTTGASKSATWSASARTIAARGRSRSATIRRLHTERSSRGVLRSREAPTKRRQKHSVPQRRRGHLVHEVNAVGTRTELLIPDHRRTGKGGCGHKGGRVWTE